MIDWKTLGAAYLTIFLAELGDKTQLATLSLASGSRGAKLAVFLGSALALCTTSAVAVLGGEALSRVISPVLLRRIAGVAFLVLGVLYLWPRAES
jgi:putative Ca2+/H+ antiporter (TMEM165/GDT1 family)